MYINMSYSLFIFNIFLKEWEGDIKSSRGTKRFGRGGGGWGSSPKLVHKKIFINKAVQTKSLYLYEAPRSISIWLNSIRQYLIKQKDR